MLKGFSRKGKRADGRAGSGLGPVISPPIDLGDPLRRCELYYGSMLADAEPSDYLRLMLVSIDGGPFQWHVGPGIESISKPIVSSDRISRIFQSRPFVARESAEVRRDVLATKDKEIVFSVDRNARLPRGAEYAVSFNLFIAHDS